MAAAVELVAAVIAEGPHSWMVAVIVGEHCNSIAEVGVDDIVAVAAAAAGRDFVEVGAAVVQADTAVAGAAVVEADTAVAVAEMGLWPWSKKGSIKAVIPHLWALLQQNEYRPVSWSQPLW